MSKGLILWCGVQCWWHASLPKENTGNNRDDPSHGQTAAGQFHWNGHIHGKLRATSQPSHWTTPCNAQARGGLRMGWNGKCQLPEDQGSDCQECHQATPLLWPKETSHSTGGCLPKRTWCMLTTGWPANCIHQQEPHRHWDQVRKHRKRAPCHCIHLSMVQHLCTGKAIYSGIQSQATGNDTPEEPCQCPSQTAEDAPPVTAIWCDHQTREGNAAHRCTEQVPLTNFWGNQTGYESRLHCLQQDLDSQTQGYHQGRPHSWCPAHELLGKSNWIWESITLPDYTRRCHSRLHKEMARNAYADLSLPKSHCRLTRCHKSLGRESWWTTSTWMAGCIFWSVITSANSPSCFRSRPRVLPTWRTT